MTALGLYGNFGEVQGDVEAKTLVVEYNPAQVSLEVVHMVLEELGFPVLLEPGNLGQEASPSS